MKDCAQGHAGGLPKGAGGSGMKYFIGDIRPGKCVRVLDEVSYSEYIAANRVPVVQLAAGSQLDPVQVFGPIDLLEVSPGPAAALEQLIQAGEQGR